MLCVKHEEATSTTSLVTAIYLIHGSDAMATGHCSPYQVAISAWCVRARLYGANAGKGMVSMDRLADGAPCSRPTTCRKGWTDPRLRARLKSFSWEILPTL